MLLHPIFKWQICKVAASQMDSRCQALNRMPHGFATVPKLPYSSDQDTERLGERGIANAKHDMGSCCRMQRSTRITFGFRARYCTFVLYIIYISVFDAHRSLRRIVGSTVHVDWALQSAFAIPLLAACLQRFAGTSFGGVRRRFGAIRLTEERWRSSLVHCCPAYVHHSHLLTSRPSAEHPRHSAS